MKIELKSVKFSEALSEETNAFTADVWANGKKVGYAKNDGHGGCTFVHAYPEQRQLFEQAEQHLMEQPQINIGTEDKPFLIDSDMEAKVDHLFEEWLEKKEEKKMYNQMLKGLVLQRPNGYAIISWKNTTIQQFLSTLKSRTFLQREVNKLKEKGEIILNNNLPDGWLN